MFMVENITGVLTWISVTCEENFRGYRAISCNFREGTQPRVTHVDLNDK